MTSDRLGTIGRTCVPSPCNRPVSFRRDPVRKTVVHPLKLALPATTNSDVAMLAPSTQDAPVPPQNLDAEESVLGAMMLSPGAIGAVSEVLDASDFYRESHAKIYRCALSLYARGEPVDAITLVDELEERGDLEGRRWTSADPRARGARPGDRERRPLRQDRPRDGDPARPDPRGRRGRAARLGAARRRAGARRPGRADRLRALAEPRSRPSSATSRSCSRRASSGSRRSTKRARTSPACRRASATSTG